MLNKGPHVIDAVRIPEGILRRRFGKLGWLWGAVIVTPRADTDHVTTDILQRATISTIISQAHVFAIDATPEQVARLRQPHRRPALRLQRPAGPRDGQLG